MGVVCRVHKILRGAFWKGFRYNRPEKSVGIIWESLIKIQPICGLSCLEAWGMITSEAIKFSKPEYQVGRSGICWVWLEAVPMVLLKKHLNNMLSRYRSHAHVRMAASGCSQNQG